jgi:hypothetical protein
MTRFLDLKGNWIFGKIMFLEISKYFHCCWGLSVKKNISMSGVLLKSILKNYGTLFSFVLNTSV